MSNDKWMISNSFARSAFDFYGQERQTNEGVCSVNNYNNVSREVQTYNWLRQILHNNKLLCRRMVSNINFECGCCKRFVKMVICFFDFEKWEDHRFEGFGCFSLIDSVQFILCNGTNISSSINQGIYCWAVFEIQRDVQPFFVSF